MYMFHLLVCLLQEVELHKLHREAEEIKFQLQQLSTGVSSTCVVSIHK